MSVPTMFDEICATVSAAVALVMPAEAPVSWNFTGTVLPSLNTELPSALIGCRMPDHEYWTCTGKDPVVVLPAGSLAVQVTAVVPGGKVEPDPGVQVAVTGPTQRSVAET